MMAYCLVDGKEVEGVLGSFLFLIIMLKLLCARPSVLGREVATRLFLKIASSMGMYALD